MSIFVGEEFIASISASWYIMIASDWLQYQSRSGNNLWR